MDDDDGDNIFFDGDCDDNCRDVAIIVGGGGGGDGDVGDTGIFFIGDDDDDLLPIMLNFINGSSGGGGDGYAQHRLGKCSLEEPPAQSTVSVLTLMRHTSRCLSIDPASVRGGTRLVGDARPGYMVTGCSLTIDSKII